jgi:hypothetical protein
VVPLLLLPLDMKVQLEAVLWNFTTTTVTNNITTITTG